MRRDGCGLTQSSSYTALSQPLHSHNLFGPRCGERNFSQSRRGSTGDKGQWSIPTLPRGDHQTEEKQENHARMAGSSRSLLTAPHPPFRTSISCSLTGLGMSIRIPSMTSISRVENQRPSLIRTDSCNCFSPIHSVVHRRMLVFMHYRQQEH